MFDVTRWWYKRGVAGFRLDAVDTLFEDPDSYAITRCRPEINQYGDHEEDDKYNDEASRSPRRASRPAQGGRRIQRAC